MRFFEGTKFLCGFEGKPKETRSFWSPPPKERHKAISRSHVFEVRSQRVRRSRRLGALPALPALLAWHAVLFEATHQEKTGGNENGTAPRKTIQLVVSFPGTLGFIASVPTHAPARCVLVLLSLPVLNLKLFGMLSLVAVKTAKTVILPVAVFWYLGFSGGCRLKGI